MTGQIIYGIHASAHPTCVSVHCYLAWTRQYKKSARHAKHDALVLGSNKKRGKGKRSRRRRHTVPAAIEKGKTQEESYHRNKEDKKGKIKEMMRMYYMQS